METVKRFIMISDKTAITIEKKKYKADLFIAKLKQTQKNWFELFGTKFKNYNILRSKRNSKTTKMFFLDVDAAGRARNYL